MPPTPLDNRLVSIRLTKAARRCYTFRRTISDQSRQTGVIVGVMLEYSDDHIDIHSSNASLATKQLASSVLARGAPKSSIR
jgi:hypothetical protein